jgi:hypothetical protein
MTRACSYCNNFSLGNITYSGHQCTSPKAIQRNPGTQQCGTTQK